MVSSAATVLDSLGLVPRKVWIAVTNKSINMLGRVTNDIINTAMLSQVSIQCLKRSHSIDIVVLMSFLFSCPDVFHLNYVCHSISTMCVIPSQLSVPFHFN